jgi:hypothetical protein
VGTQLFWAENLELSARTKEVLMSPRFVIVPDNSHLPQNNGGQDPQDQPSPSPSTPVALLHERQSRLYLRVDPDFTQAFDDAGARALRELYEAIEAKVVSVPLEPGDYIFIDNYRALHGRESFQPSYDGSDRWLKRINISRNLRPARVAGEVSEEFNTLK